jgi:4-amino-4-deoxy-L-arabinose transferase-like glycosyltransferase
VVEKQKKKSVKNPVFLLLLSGFLITRLTKLLTLPIFNDEATYIDWSWRMLNLQGEFFHSVKFAKPPLMMWVIGILRKFISDPLLAGRLVSVFAGAFLLFGIYKIANTYLNRKAALAACILYIVLPPFVFYDRQALMETAVAASGIWAFYYLVKYLDTKKYLYAGILGAILGLGYLIKTSAIVFFIATCVVLGLQMLSTQSKRVSIIKGSLITTSFYLITLFPLLFNNIFWKTLDQNSKYAFTVTDLMKFPVDAWFKNLEGLITISLVYLNPAIVIFALVSTVFLYRKKREFSINLLIFIFLGIFFLIFINRNINVRYWVAFMPLTLLIPGYGFSVLYSKAKYVMLILTSIVLLPSIYISTLLVFSPLKYFNVLNFTNHSQKNMYVTYWSSGYGVNEMRSTLSELSKGSPTIAAVRLDAGIPENAVFAYFENSKNIFPIYLDSQLIRDTESYDCISSKIPVYFVSRDNQMAGLEKFFTEIKKIKKPEGDHYIGIHELNSECEGNTLSLTN